MNIVPLGSDDVEQAIALSTEVGWNQNAADWRRLIALNPRACLGIRKAGRLAATATLASYGNSLGWVGMVIVSALYRGQGLARTLLDEVLRCGEGEGIQTLGLDATELGQPVYHRLGFCDVAPVNRWSGVLSVGAEAGLSPAGVDLDAIMVMDRGATGVDRSALLKQFSSEPGVTLFTTTRGYAFLRPGREFPQLGPAVAETEADFFDLLRQAAQHLAGESILLDAVNSADVSLALSRAGLTVQRTLIRMTRPGGTPVLGGGWQLAAGLELG